MNKTKEDKLPPNTSMESQSTVLFMQPRHYYMSNAECSHMGNKLCIDCLQQNFTYNEDLRGSILAELPQMQKTHEVPFTHGLLLETLCEKVPEQSIIEIYD